MTTDPATVDPVPQLEAGDVVVCDRSVLDNYCYMVHAAGTQKIWERFLDYWIRSYELLIHVPPWVRPTYDGVRAVDARFQEQIERPADADIFVAMLWSRLGTPLSGNFVRDDGTRFRSGTEFEFENAFRSFEDTGRPRILVYRKTATPIVALDDEEAVTEHLHQKKALDAFLDLHEAAVVGDIRDATEQAGAVRVAPVMTSLAGMSAADLGDIVFVLLGALDAQQVDQGLHREPLDHEGEGHDSKGHGQNLGAIWEVRCQAQREGHGDTAVQASPH